MNTKYTYEVVEDDAMREEDLEEIASLLAQMIYQLTVREDHNIET
jgi:hypothetical protein